MALDLKRPTDISINGYKQCRKSYNKACIYTNCVHTNMCAHTDTHLYKFNIPYLKCLGPGEFQISDIFQILEYSHKEMGMGLKSKHKIHLWFIYICGAYV